MKLLVYTVYRVEQNYYTKSDLLYEYYYGVVVGGSPLNFARYLYRTAPARISMHLTNVCIFVFVRYLCLHS